MFARIEHNVRLLDIPRQHAEHAFELAFWRGFCKIVTRLFAGFFIHHGSVAQLVERATENR